MSNRLAGGISVVGAGMVGAAHAAAYRAYFPRFVTSIPGVELVSVCDARKAIAADVASRYGFNESTTDWRAVIADPRVGIVSIALPNADHEAVALAALKAGKHVLCEKPLALTAESARRLADAAAEAAERLGVVACTMFNYRRVPAIAEALRRVNAGEIGTLIDLSIAYRAEYAADPALPFSWRYDRAAAGGGALTDLGTHAIDLAMALCGPVRVVVGAVQSVTVAERQLPLSASVGHSLAAVGTESRMVDTDDSFSALLRFEGGCHGLFSASRVAVGYGNALSFTLSGAEGTVRFDSERSNGYDIAIRQAGEAAHFQRVSSGSRSPYVNEYLPVPHDGVTVGYAEAFGFAVADFLSAIATGSPVSSSFEDGARAAEVLEAMQDAERTGASVRLGAQS